MQVDLFSISNELQAIEMIRSQITSLNDFEIIETDFCEIEKSRRFYTIKTNDFDISFPTIAEVLYFIELASREGWEKAYHKINFFE